jgi:hypothetical protein
MKLTTILQDFATLDYAPEEDDGVHNVLHSVQSRKANSYVTHSKNYPAIPEHIDVLIEIAPYGQPVITSAKELTSSIRSSIVFEHDEEFYKQFLSLVNQNNSIDIAHCLPSSENGVKILDNKSSVVSTRLDLMIPVFSDEHDNVAIILTNRININDALYGAEDSFDVIKTVIFIVPIEELHSSSSQLNIAQSFLQNKGYTLESINTIYHNSADYVETIFVKQD